MLYDSVDRNDILGVLECYYVRDWPLIEGSFDLFAVRQDSSYILVLSFTTYIFSTWVSTKTSSTFPSSSFVYVAFSPVPTLLISKDSSFPR